VDPTTGEDSEVSSMAGPFRTQSLLATPDPVVLRTDVVSRTQTTLHVRWTWPPAGRPAGGIIGGFEGARRALCAS
jgi:hypothetical protein